VERLMRGGDSAEAHYLLGSASFMRGDYPRAEEDFRKALALNPDFTEAHAGLGGVLARTGRTDEAIPHLGKAVEQSPQDFATRTNLVLALSLAGRAEEAIPHAQEAVHLSAGRNPLILDLLGRLYAQTGRLPEAIETTRQALEIAIQANEERLARDLRARLSSYEAGASGSRDRSARTRSP